MTIWLLLLIVVLVIGLVALAFELRNTSQRARQARAQSTRDFAELRSLKEALEQEPPDVVLILFCNSLANAAQAYEKRTGAPMQPFAMSKPPLQAALRVVLRFYLDCATLAAYRA